MKIVVDLTNKCNLSCKHCGATKLKDCPEGVMLNFFKELNSDIIDSVDLLGGEPFLHPNIFEIINILNKKGILINIITNGQFNDDFINRISQNNISSIFVSIDGLEKDNDNLRGKGSFKKADNFLKKIIKNNNRFHNISFIGVNTVINVYNKDNLIPFMLYLNGFGENIGWQINPLLGEGKAAENRDLFIKNEDEIDILENIAKNVNLNKNLIVSLNYNLPLILEYLNKRYSTEFPVKGYQCDACISTIYCDEFGDLYPCRKYRKKILSVESMERFQETSKEFLKLSLIENHYIGCDNCAYTGICNNCPLEKERQRPELCQVCENRYVEYINSFKNCIYMVSKDIILENLKNKLVLISIKNDKKYEYDVNGKEIYSLINGKNTVMSISQKLDIDLFDVSYFLYNELIKSNIRILNNSI